MNRQRGYGLLLLLGVFVLLSLPNGVYTTAQDVSPDIGGRLEWSPDGTELAVIANNGVFIYDRAFQLLRYREQDIPNYTADPSGDACSGWMNNTMATLGSDRGW